MKISFDPEADALYIELKEGAFRTEHWSASVAADYDVQGHLAGIEILDVSQQIADLNTLKQVNFKQYEPSHPD